MEERRKNRVGIDNNEDVLDLDESDFRKLVLQEFRKGRATMHSLQESLQQNTELTKKNIDSTAELVEIFKTAKTGVSVFTWTGKNLRRVVTFLYPFILIGGAIAAVIHGKWPKMD